MAWYDNITNMRGYENINKTGTQAWPEYNENFGKSFAGVQRFDPRNLMRPSNLSQDMGASNYQAPPPKEEEIINENIHLDVGNNSSITPNIPRPGENWPGFGIPRAIAETGFRMKGGPYYSQKFPSREFTEGDKAYSQSGLGGYYHPDEVFNMQQFGGVGEGDPRKDKFGKNIVSFADDYEEGLEDWVGKYGTMKYNTARMQKKQKDKIAMWNKIQARRKGIEDANRAASNQHLARQGITHSGPGGGGGAFIDPGGRDRGGQGAFRENVAQMRGAARSYTDAQGNVGYSSGRKDGGRMGYNRGRVVNPGGYAGEEEFEDENTLEFMRDQGIPHSDMAGGDDFILQEQYQKYLFEMEELNLEPMSFEQFKAEAMMAEGEGDQGIASLV